MEHSTNEFTVADIAICALDKICSLSYQPQMLVLLFILEVGLILLAFP
jgi:hypothetical protein